MQYKKVSDIQGVVSHLADTLTSHLNNGERVLWLIPGGSAIKIAIEVSKRLSGTDMQNLHVTLTDERYGSVGHEDSNWQQLADKGFTLPGAQLNPVLANLEVSETTEHFADYLDEQLSDADFSIGLFGMGADGHTAGILPASPAVLSTNFAAQYQASNFLRITMTPRAIAMLDESVVYAVGAEKIEPLENLKKEIDLTIQPAQILKKVPSLTIYNDYEGDEL